MNKTNKVDQRAQPAGVPGATSSGSGDDALFALHAYLCELESDPEVRASLLRVPVAVDAAWTNGRMLPVLRANRKLLQSTIAQLERRSGN